MAVFRVEKSADYTVMSNYHLRDTGLSLKAKGLLSQMLSLPKEWDYTLSGLARINKESKDAIRSAVKELEQAGYINRRQTMDADGKFAGNEYVIHELPVSDSPLLDFPTTENPSTENPSPEKPLTENPTELNKDILSKDISKKENKKRKKATIDPLPVFVEWIGNAFPSASREDKNNLYQHLAAYADMRKDSKSPLNTERKVSGLLEDLIEQSQGSIPVMCEMLKTAKRRCWLSVHAPKELARASPPEEGDVMVI